MTRYRLTAFGAVCLITLGGNALCRAQALLPREELLRYIPKDFGLCFVLNDLRGHAAKWEQSPWIKAVQESALGRALLEAPEFKEMLKFQEELKKHLDVDWPALRDDVLGDAVVFAFQPGPPGKPGDEQGILLLHSHRPEVLVRLLDNLNRAQKASGELKSLQTRNYKGTQYFCRLESKENHYYLLSGRLFAFTAQEELLKRILEQDRRGPPALADHLKKAGADDALASIWINPRAFDADLEQKARGVPDSEAVFLKMALKSWYALDAVVLSFAARDNIEVRLSFLAREMDLPPAARAYFTTPARPSDLWQRFPDNAIVSLTGRLDASDIAEALADGVPPHVQHAFQTTLQPLAALVGIDLARDLLPNVGPDWGLCILPATAPNKLPEAIAALAVRPGTKDKAVDQALYRGAQFLAGLAVLDYNRRHPQDPIRLSTRKQENVEIKYLANDNIFPPGFQPACALKDGYLLFATTPEAVARFRPATGTGAAGTEAPLLRISSKELAKVLRDHRQRVIDWIASHDETPTTAAALAVDNALSALDLLDHVEITRSGGAGRASFILRIIPAKQ